MKIALLSMVAGFLLLSSSPPLANEPTLPPNNLRGTWLSDGSLKLTWDGGNGEGNIVTCYASANNSGFRTPRDGSIYPTRSTPDNGSCLYLGTGGCGKSTYAKDLRPGYAYEFRVFEFNGHGGTINYLDRPAVLTIMVPK